MAARHVWLWRIHNLQLALMHQGGTPRRRQCGIGNRQDQGSSTKNPSSPSLQSIDSIGLLNNLIIPGHNDNMQAPVGKVERRR